jgi:RND superfamily putative drug exporter
MRFGTYFGMICRRPGLVIVSAIALAAVVVVAAPNLTDLIAVRPARLLPEDSESRRAVAMINATWPDQGAVSVVVIALSREAGIRDADRECARRLAARCAGPDRPSAILGVMGPGSGPEADARLLSRDGRVQLVVVRLSDTFVGPAVGKVIDWLRARVKESTIPKGLDVTWTGDGVFGTEFMNGIRTTLDRAAWAMVGLILAVLLVVYRSVWLALVPLITIGLGLAITRGVLGWLVQAGWELSMLAELFLVVILFGCGTDFCLLLTWRFAGQWDRNDPAAAMATTLRKVWEPLLTSAGTVIVGLALMGTTRFALFSRTGPAVALGLALTLAVCLTFTPAVLVTLARYRPGAFSGLKKKSLGIWPALGRRILAQPVAVAAMVLGLMAVPAVFGLRGTIVHDLLAALPSHSAAVQDFRRLGQSFGTGAMAPLTVVLESRDDLRRPGGMALIDALSQGLADQEGVARVRSATRPAGDPAQLDAARIVARLDQLLEGVDRIAQGNRELHQRMTQAAAKLRIGREIGRFLRSGRTTTDGSSLPDAIAPDLNEAIEGTRRLSEGSSRARDALAAILDDRDARAALAPLLITATDREARPDLEQALAYYISADGHRARIEVEPVSAMFSTPGIDTVDRLRRGLAEEVKVRGRGRVRAWVGGVNADWADVRSQTRADQRRIWWVIPLGVGLILLVALRSVLATLNLVATMLLTYLFALGTTHLVFVVALGSAGIDWTVPYFLFILLVAVGVDYNIFLMARLREESVTGGIRNGIVRAVGHTGPLISSAAMITLCSFAAFLFSPLSSLRQLGFALMVGIAVDALLVRPVLVPCGHWLLNRRVAPAPAPAVVATSS